MNKKIPHKNTHTEENSTGLLIIFIIFIAIILTLLYRQHSQLLPSTSMLSTSGTSLVLFGKKTQFTGINAYELATNPSMNVGCGPTVKNPDMLFAKLRPHSLVRIWGFQGSMVRYNLETKQFDWSALDKVFQSAAKYKQLLIVSLGNQWGTCDDNRYKDTTWYTGGYTSVYNPSGTTPVSYWDYMQAIVTRYKTNTSLGMWELINEPEAKQCTSNDTINGVCSDTLICNESAAEQTLYNFFDTVGKEVKTLDPYHLVESGFVGGGQCGTSGKDYQLVHTSTGIDVASYHDYNANTSSMPGDQYNGLLLRINQMKEVNKPLIIGEVGIKAQDNTIDCSSLATRRMYMERKMNAQFSFGVAAFIPWNWVPSNNGQCAYETITNTDPLMSLLYKYPLQNN